MSERERRTDAAGLVDWAIDGSPVRVRPGTVRYRDPRQAGPAPQSAAIVGQLSEIRAEQPPGIRPEFGGGPERGVVRVACPAGASFYGTGEVAGPLRRNGRTTTCWNTDSFGYEIETPSLYQSHPWVLGIRDDGTAFGVLFDTTRRCVISLDGHVEAVCDGGSPPVYVLEAGSPAGLLEELAGLIGTTPLPPRWALGFHQCRYSYANEHEVLSVAEAFRDRWMPCDTLWLDIDYADRARTFTISGQGFPDPARLVSQLRGRGFRTVWILDPAVKIDEDYDVYREGLALNGFVRRADGAPFEGEVWPGLSVFPDFTRADVRRWWGERTARFVGIGADGLWNDMNEPSVFDGPGRTIPEDARHEADADLGGPGDHATYHNIYGMQMARATFEGLLRERPDRRPFVLSRSNFIGGHRYACCWTGDSASTWDHLAWTIPMMLNLGLSGQPFAGCDIGGFADNADGELFARWMGIGALLPFARAHSDKGTNRHEPWSFGPACEHACRVALERRYRLIPFLYTLFREAERTGVPPMRPLFFADPADPALREAEDSFMLGPDVLVRASATPDNICRAPMPAGRWRAFEPVGGGDANLPALFLRAGAILPLGPMMQHTGGRPLDPLTLLVHLDDDGHAEGTLYEDEGDGFGYRRGDYLLTRYRATREGNHVRVGVAGREGDRARPLRVAEVVVLLEGGRSARATGVGGDSISVLIGEPNQRPIAPDP